MKKPFLLILPLLIYFGCTGVDRTEELQEKLAKYERQNELLEEKISALQDSMDSLVQMTLNVVDTSNYWFDKHSIPRVLRNDDRDAEKFIANALRERRDLIPLEPVLGGTMRFVRIQLLGENWLIADYEDGHIRGRSMYEYHFNKDGEVDFRKIASSPE